MEQHEYIRLNDLVDTLKQTTYLTYADGAHIHVYEAEHAYRKAAMMLSELLEELRNTQ